MRGADYFFKLNCLRKIISTFIMSILSVSPFVSIQIIAARIEENLLHFGLFDSPPQEPFSQLLRAACVQPKRQVENDRKAVLIDRAPRA